MKTLMKIFASIFAVLVIAVLVFIGWFFNLFAFTHDWHQKLTVVVETPQGVRSSSSVIRVAGEPGSGPHGNFHSLHTYGEATVVKLPAADGKSRYLFVLLGRQKGLVKDLFRNELVAKGARFNYPSPASAWMSKVDKLTGTPAKQLLPNDYPLLVTFTDINDPKTVKRVDPNDLDAAFGCGNSISPAIPAAPGPATARTDRPDASSASDMSVITSEERAAQRPSGADVPASGVSENKKCYSLKSITLEITDEPLTRGAVEGVLEWLGKYPEPGLCKATGRSSNIPFCRRVHHGDLIRR